MDIFRDIDLVDAVPSNTIRHDLTVYLNYRLNSIRQSYNERLRGTVALKSDWPSDEKILQLAEMTVPLFIIAATVCRFIGDLRFDPQARLEKILQNWRIGEMSQMELTYRPVLENLIDTEEDDESREELYHNFGAIVGSIVVLAEPLSVSSLATLLDLSTSTISQQLASLHSVLQAPVSQHIPVRTLHLSFAEYLLSAKAQSQPFRVDSPSRHLALGGHCVRLLSGPGGLRENICDLDFPGKSRQEIDSIAITSHLSPAIQYACRYWVYHVKYSNYQLEDNDNVHSFLKRHFLHWLEALSLLDRLSDAISLLGILQSCVAKNASNLLDFLEDARRFVLAHRYVIDLAPLQLYSSAIILTPENSLVKTICGDIPVWIRQYPQTTKTWGPELQTLEGHFDVVRSLAFSPDGSLLASRSDDRTIRLWNTQTGQEVQKLEGHSECNFIGHSDNSFKVAFSPDGSLLAEPNADETWLWNIQTGQATSIFENHYGQTMAVAFSPEGYLLIAEPSDDTIHLWNTRTGQEVQTLEAQIRVPEQAALSPEQDELSSGQGRLSPEQVALSPDCSLLAVGSDDGIIHIWNIWTGQVIQKIKGSPNRIKAVIFSPVGNLLASGSHDGAIILWDTQTGRNIQKVEGIPGSCWTVAFSPDSSLLAAGSEDFAIRVWNTQTGQEIQKLDGRNDRAQDVVFSPDGAIIASGAPDGTIRLWNVQTERWQEFQTHNQFILDLLFSPNGSLLASCVRGGIIRLWDKRKGQWQELQMLEGHTGTISMQLKFSPDGSLLASGSDGGTIQLWDKQKGQWQELQMLEGHTETISVLTFSPDGSLLAAGGLNGTIQLWHKQKGQWRGLQILEGHISWIKVIIFSPDGSLLASGSYDGTMRLWDKQREQWREARRFTNSFRWSNRLLFSPDSSLLIRASDDTVWVFDTQTGRNILTFNNLSIHQRPSFANSTTLIIDQDMYDINSGTVIGTSNISQIEEPLTVSNDWIRHKGRNLLWIPPDYRNITKTYNNSVAIGRASGRIAIFQFDLS